MSGAGGGRPGLTRKGRRRWQIWMGIEDFDNAGDVMRAHGHRDIAQAVRFALQQQAARDRAAAPVKKPKEKPP